MNGKLKVETKNGLSNGEKSNKNEKLDIVSCEVCESVKSPLDENALEHMPERTVHEMALTESNVIMDRYQTTVRQPPAQAPNFTVKNSHG